MAERQLHDTRYSDLDNVSVIRSFGKKPPTTTFPDSHLLPNPGVSLSQLNPQQITTLGRWCLPMLQSGFTKRGSSALFLLAYNLHYRTQGGNNFDPVFYDGSVENLPHDTPYHLLPDTRIGGGANINEYRSIAPTGNEWLESLYYCYIAASLLRVFRKPAEGYVRGWNEIVSGFSRLYNVDVPVVLGSPSLEAVKGLENWWRRDSVCEMSLYKLLYAGGGDHGKASELKVFLYDKYLPNAGLHVVDIFVSLMRVLNCSSDELIRAIDGRLFSREREGLGVMMRLMGSEEEENKRKMWRYGRIFDEGFMADLQTKTCDKLVYALAVALKEVAPGENDGILNIAQLQCFKAEWKVRCEKYGKGVVTAVRTGVPQNNIRHFIS